MATPSSALRSLDDLLAEQRELNSRVAHEPSALELKIAFLAEVGEVADALKFGMGERADYAWCWWKRETARATDRDDVLMELVDVLHFILIGLLNDEPSGWEPWFTYDRFWEEPSIYPWGECLFRMTTAFDKGEYYMSLLYLVMTARALGFQRAEYEDAYFRKTQINRERWEA